MKFRKVPCTITMLVVVILTLSVTTAEGAARSKGYGKKKLPNVIMFGTAKSGTDALIRMLGLHPDVAIASGEPAFFNNHTKYNQFGLKWYRKRMPAGSAKKIIVLEKSPYYFAHQRVPERVHRYNSSVRLLLLVREPVLRLISDYVHAGYRSQVERLHHVVSQYSFEEMFDGDWDEEQVNKAWARHRLLRDSMYVLHLRKWLAYFPMEQILVLDGDLLSRNPVEVVRQTWKWLDLNPDLVSESSFYFNSTKGQWCWYQQERKTCLGSRKGRTHPEVGPAIREKLKRYFSPQNEEFFGLIGKRFPGWDSKEKSAQVLENDATCPASMSSCVEVEAD